MGEPGAAEEARIQLFLAVLDKQMKCAQVPPPAMGTSRLMLVLGEAPQGQESGDAETSIGCCRPQDAPALGLPPRAQDAWLS